MPSFNNTIDLLILIKYRNILKINLLKIMLNIIIIKYLLEKDN